MFLKKTCYACFPNKHSLHRETSLLASHSDVNQSDMSNDIRYIDCPREEINCVRSTCNYLHSGVNICISRTNFLYLTDIIWAWFVGDRNCEVPVSHV